MAQQLSTPSQTIARLCLDCQSQFEVLRDAIRSKNKDRELSSVAVQNELGRFRIWASNIGAMHTGRLSLDYKLQDAEYLYEDVKSLLEDIKDSLLEGLFLRIHADMLATSLANDKDQNARLYSRPELNFETQSATSNLPDCDSSDESVREVVEENTYCLRGYYNQVINFVNKLFDISILIRKASRKFRTRRAAAHVEKDAEGEDVLSEFKYIISLKIKGLYPRTPPWLVQRLADVITKRRQLFYYQKAHARRRAKNPVALESKHFISKATKCEEPVTDPHLPTDAKTTKTKSSMKTYTTASEAIPKEEQLIGQSFGKPTLTEMRMTESAFPNPPKSGKYNTFTCNQCFEMLHAKMREPKSWRSVSGVFSTKFGLDNIFFQTFDHIPVFLIPVMITTNSSRLEKDGLSMKLSSIIMNGGVIALMTRSQRPEYTHQKKNFGIIFKKNMLTPSPSPTWLS